MSELQYIKYSLASRDKSHLLGAIIFVNSFLLNPSTHLNQNPLHQVGAMDFIFEWKQRLLCFHHQIEFGCIIIARCAFTFPMDDFTWTRDF